MATHATSEGGAGEAEHRPAPEGLVERVEQLTAELDAIDHPGARATAQELMGSIIELYGEGLERIFEALSGAGPAGEAIRQELTDDGVVGSLLLIHGLYPVDLEARVVEALESVRPYMESHGGNVELLGVEDGIARLRLEGSCEGCPSSSATLELAIEQALEEAAPDLLGLEVEGLEPRAEAGGTNGGMGTALPLAPGGPVPEPPAPHWFNVDGVGRLEPGELFALSVSRAPLVFANVEGTLLAYRNTCPGCAATVEGGELSGGLLRCPSCSRRFDLPRAGRSLDDEPLQLEPVPLLSDETGIRVSLAA